MVFTVQGSVIKLAAWSPRKRVPNSNSERKTGSCLCQDASHDGPEAMINEIPDTCI